jgi:ribonuclease J
MSVEIAAVGGYGEVGRNMTAVRVGKDVVIFDMGLHMPNYVRLTEEEEAHFERKLDEAKLRKAQAIPDDRSIRDWHHMVRAIVVSHAHLDHLGAAPYVAAKYNCPIIATPYTTAVLRHILEDEHISLPNQLKPLPPNSRIRLSPDLELEFIHVTHSTPGTIIAALHTKEGTIVYGNDFKLDNRPVVGKKPNYEALERLGKDGVKALIIECLYAWEARKTPSESVAKEMLRDVMLGVNSKGKAVIVTTFASHIARLKSIVDFAKELGRKPVFMGRSIEKYASAAEEADITTFSQDAELCHHGGHVKKWLRKAAQDPSKYLLVVTGHQGEPRAVLSRIARGELPFQLKKDDIVIFSCTVIPAPINKANRERLEGELRKRGVRMFKDIHVSGHVFREDLRDFIKMMNPEHLFPTHGARMMTDSFNGLAKELDYHQGRNLHVLYTGRRMKLPGGQ